MKESQESRRLPVSVILVTHDATSRARAVPVINALKLDPAGPNEVVLVDNASSEQAATLASARDLTLVQRSGGFSDGCNAGVEASAEPCVVLLGHDTVPEDGWLVDLIAALAEPEVAAAIPVIEDGRVPGTFNTSGGHLTYVGLAWVSDHGRSIPTDLSSKVVDFPCGGAMAMKREVWDRFGGFRGEYFLYQEDSDLGWRLRLAGLKTVLVPGSRVIHDYEFGRQGNKMFLLERNRLFTVLSNYKSVTLFLLAPVLLATEVATLLVAIRDGWFGAKVRSWSAVWKDRRLIHEGRRLSDSNRVLSDREMIATMSCELSGMPEIDAPRGVGAASRVLRIYRSFVVRLLAIVERH